MSYKTLLETIFRAETNSYVHEIKTLVHFLLFGSESLLISQFVLLLSLACDVLFQVSRVSYIASRILSLPLSSLSRLVTEKS